MYTTCDSRAHAIAYVPPPLVPLSLPRTRCNYRADPIADRLLLACPFLLFLLSLSPLPLPTPSSPPPVRDSSPRCSVGGLRPRRTSCTSYSHLHGRQRRRAGSSDPPIPSPLPLLLSPPSAVLIVAARRKRVVARRARLTPRGPE